MAAHHHPHASCLVHNRPRCSSRLGLLQTKRKEQLNSGDVNLDQPIYTTTTPWLRTLTGILQYVAHDLSLTAGISFCDWIHQKFLWTSIQHACVQININSIQCAISQVIPMFNVRERDSYGHCKMIVTWIGFQSFYWGQFWMLISQIEAI